MNCWSGGEVSFLFCSICYRIISRMCSMRFCPCHTCLLPKQTQHPLMWNYLYVSTAVELSSCTSIVKLESWTCDYRTEPDHPVDISLDLLGPVEERRCAGAQALGLKAGDRGRRCPQGASQLEDC
eukprot:TRINITY_DN27742_c0_g2_i4.p1 TRINITY_DN27742_c0_g2~~TRINITY_DN27742_c0_g2_i4.p1  ORF type:complete len:125 (+),score=0.33 TRINITY_DN27742_c0_g2_i4:552-926(+)